MICRTTWTTSPGRRSPNSGGAHGADDLLHRPVGKGVDEAGAGGESLGRECCGVGGRDVGDVSVAVRSAEAERKEWGVAVDRTQLLSAYGYDARDGAFCLFVERDGEGGTRYVGCESLAADGGRDGGGVEKCGFHEDDYTTISPYRPREL